VKNIEAYLVPWLEGQEMYISHHIELAWQRPELQRMMSNENPFGPSQKVLDAINEYARVANRYPDQGLVVRSKIAEIWGVDGPENVVIGNGSSEVYDNIFRSFLLPGEQVIQHTPCFGIYKLRCKALGGELVSVPMIYDREAGEFQFDPDAVLDAITPKTKVIVIANPNNPTGNLMDEVHFGRIADTGVPFVIDEAYIEIAGVENSMIRLLEDYENVMLTYTLSKAYGLAALRFGYMIARKKVVDAISSMLIPWNVGTIAMWAGLAALEDQETMRKRVEFIRREVGFIEGELEQIPGLTVFHSKGNYILFDGQDTGKMGDELVEYAQERGVILRPRAPMYGSDGFWRLTVGTEDQNRLAVSIVKEFYTESTT
jgi:histidinol-phosphate aminotransferase